MKLRPFELGLVIIFILLGVVALVVVSNYKSPAKAPASGVVLGSVSIWGTIPKAAVDTVIAQLELQDEQYERVSYRYINPEVFDTQLLSALADRVGPDLILVSHERLVEMRNVSSQSPLTLSHCETLEVGM